MHVCLPCSLYLVSARYKFLCSSFHTHSGSVCVRAKMLFYLLSIDKCVAPGRHPTTPHMPWQLPGPLLPHCATHLRHEFDVVSLVTFKIVFNYFLTSSSVKSVGRPSLPTPLPLPLPPSPRHWRLWGGSRPRAKGAIVAA